MRDLKDEWMSNRGIEDIQRNVEERHARKQTTAQRTSHESNMNSVQSQN